MILCGSSPRHLYVANRLSGVSKPVAIVQEVGSEWTLRKFVKSLRPRSLWQRSWRLMRNRRRYRGGKEARFFFGDVPPRLDYLEVHKKVPFINHRSVLQLAQRHQPDLIAVYGTSLIRAPLLGLGQLGMVNLHGGLSPEYRGADCTFWALYNREPEMIGCTLHFIDKGVDSGDLIAHICPEVHPGDDELTLFWRAVRDGAEVYGEFVRRMANGERFGQPQQRRGRLYRVRDRKWRHDLALAGAIKGGLLRSVALPRRVRWFPYDDMPLCQTDPAE
jgi:methionyl-tRNA formyltransferase